MFSTGAQETVQIVTKLSSKIVQAFCCPFWPSYMILLEKRMRGLTGDLSATVSILARGEVTPESVHRLRTTARRIESLVSYANPDLDKKLERCQEKLADLRRRAGKVRDFDVQIGLLGVLANGSTARDREILAALLGKKRDRQARRLTSAV